MASTFNVNQAAGYDRLMGRWSRRLAPPFIQFAGLRDEERVLDVGCGTGSLTFELPRAASLAEIAAVDLSPIFVEEVQRRKTDDRIRVQQADACDLPFDGGYFDRALSLLVLHFVPEPAAAVSEMRRVVRPGGVVAAAVWDHLGGMSGMRMMWDTVAATSEKGREARSRYLFQPMTGPGELQRCFEAEGLRDVEATTLTIRMDYDSFDDYWGPMAAGEGPIGRYVASLPAAEQAETGRAVRAAYEGGRPDGPRSFASMAWACRGTVP